MPKTRRELVLRALDVLGVTSVGQAPTDDDYNKVDERVEPLLKRLYAEDVVYVGDVENVADEYFDPLGDILASQLVITFSLGPDEAVRLQASESAARNALMYMTRPKPSHETLKALYF